MEAVKKPLDKILYWIVVVLFAFLVFVVVWQIFTRQVVGNPSTWTEEASRMTFVWLGLFAAAFLFGERGHIAVEFVARKFRLGGQRTLSIVVQVFVLLFAVLILIWGGTRAAINAWLQDLSALPFTLGQMYVALPVSGVLIAFYALYYIAGVGRSTEAAYPEMEDPDAAVHAEPQIQEERLGDDTTVVEGDDGDPPPDSRGSHRAGPQTEA